MPDDGRFAPDDGPVGEQMPGQDRPAEPPGAAPPQPETMIKVNQEVGKITGGQATGIAIGTLEGQVTIQMPGAEPDQDLEDLRQPCIPTRRFEPETILIPRGPFLMGSLPGPDIPAHETEQHGLDLPDYRIGRYPVTVAQYRAFLQAKTDHPSPPGWFNREPPNAGRLAHPVTGVSWHDALAYCAWLGDLTRRPYALPSEAEWEKAASWAESESTEGASPRKRRYPWGSEWQDGRCNAHTGETTPVTAHPDGASAYGIEDLLGNVQQWTRSRWGRLTRVPEFGYPYDREDGREIADPDKLPLQARLVHRGGSFRSKPEELGCTARGKALAFSKVSWRGFRVAIRIG